MRPGGRPIMAAYADGLGIDPDVFARWHTARSPT